jgi:hypothetical protein
MRILGLNMNWDSDPHNLADEGNKGGNSRTCTKLQDNRVEKTLSQEEKRSIL